MSSVYNDDRSPHYTCCFTAIINGRRIQSKKTSGTANPKLARRLADELEETGFGRRNRDEILAFLGKLTDLDHRAAARQRP